MMLLFLVARYGSHACEPKKKNANAHQ